MISLGKTSKRVFIHVSLLLVVMVMVFIILILSFNKALSAFLVIILALGVLILLINLTLTGTRSSSDLRKLTAVSKILSNFKNKISAIEKIIWYKKKEDFPTVSLDDEHWNMEEIPDRHLCTHENSLPHGLCPYPCPYSDYMNALYYDTLDLSDISEFEDLMTTSSNEDIPALDEVGY